MNQPTKEQRAETLYRDGYRATLKDGLVLVHKPDRRTVYTVDPARMTCTCTAGLNAVVCKHVLGLLNLLLDTANALDIRALEHLECDRHCWRFDETGLKIANRAAALSDLAGRLGREWVGWDRGRERVAA